MTRLLVAALLPLLALAPATARANDKPAGPKLATPRQTLRALYFAVDQYPGSPAKIDGAVACLSGRDASPLAALQLEEALSRLALPLEAAPEHPEKARAVLYEGKEGTIALQHEADGAWRFERATINALPRLLQALPARKAPGPEWRFGYHSPRAALRSFLADVQSGNVPRSSIALDLTSLSSEDRRDKRVKLAFQLGYVLQRRGYVFLQAAPDDTDGPAWTWSADKHGRIRLAPGKIRDLKAWLFTPETVAAIPAMYEALKKAPADPLYVERGLALAPIGPDNKLPIANGTPPGVIPKLRSPRAVLKGLFSAVEDGQNSDARMKDAADFLDLGGIAPADRAVRGPRLAGYLDLILKGVPFSLDDVPDTWSAAPQVLGAAQGFTVEILRGETGWRFSEETVARIPAMYLKLPAKARQSQERARRFDSPRDTMNTFLQATKSNDWEMAVRCLDLNYLPTAVRDTVGPVLAAKLRYILDRIGRVYLPGISDDPEGSRYVHYTGEWGRLVVAPRAKEEGETTTSWAFTAATVKQIEALYRRLRHERPEAKDDEDQMRASLPSWWAMPGLHVRAGVPGYMHRRFLGLEVYQFLGLALILVASRLMVYFGVAVINRPIRWLLKNAGVSGLGRPFIASRLRPLGFAFGLWSVYALMPLLDLPVGLAVVVLPLQKFFLAALGLWASFRLLDLGMAVYTNSEKLRDYRGLSDMIVPGALRASKATLLVLCMAYVVYQVGGGEWLGRMLTALGVLGVAVSLAAQDTVKNFLGTLTLIGERPFKIGDWIVVDKVEGVVEEVTFRSTKLRGFDGEMLTLPNAMLITASVVNKGGKAFRVFRAKYAGDGDLRALAEAVNPKLDALPDVVVRKANADVSGGLLRLTVVYLAPDEGREEKVREDVEAVLRESANGMAFREVTEGEARAAA